MKPLRKEEVEAMDLEPEVRALALAQVREDDAYQEPQRFGGDDVRVLSLQALGLDDFSEMLVDESVSGNGGEGAYDEARGPGRIGRHVQQRLGVAWPSEARDEGDLAMEDRVALVLETLTADERALYDALFLDLLSMRDASEALGIPFGSMNYRKKRLLAKMEAGLEEVVHA